MILICALVVLAAGLFAFGVYSTRRNAYRLYRSNVTSGQYTCFDLQMLIAAMQVSKKIEVRYESGPYDISSSAYIDYIVYKMEGKDGERGILLSKKDYFRFMKWYEKHLEQQHKCAIANRCTYDVIDDLQKDINIALENAQKSVADAGKKYADIVSKIGM